MSGDRHSPYNAVFPTPYKNGSRMTLNIDGTLPSPPQRPTDAHKGTFGRVLIIAGSRGMSGAAVLSGLGALRGGAGLVYLAVPKSVQPLVASAEPSYLVHPVGEDVTGGISGDAVSKLEQLAGQMSAVAVGPGMGNANELPELIEQIYARVSQPIVVDADGLNALANLGPAWHRIRPAGPRILTPHPGEFARLLKTTIAEVQANRSSLAAEFAAKHNVILLLKGAGTVITDGTRLAINQTGNPGMATGGSGDVLTGLIVALLAQGMPPFEAARLGAHLHGLAGDLAAADLSQPGLIASDLPRYLAKAWLKHQSETTAP